MTAEEAAAFESLADFESFLEMRKWDDAAKVQEIPVEDNAYYKELCKKVLSGA